ncbi:MAG: FAD-dependent thymidylate synthase [Candidatus Omnitrophica bacterium]|nr:FAD-dependent thymidylate synthase [Candidatus Omnitrophota bacterium]
MRVELLEHTPDPEHLVALAAKLCYSGVDIDELLQKVTNEQTTAFIHKLLKMGHLSPFEHISFTFGIEGISRAASHQLVRHRVASYSQQSQRYVTYQNLEYVVPPSISSAGLSSRFSGAMEYLQGIYHELIVSGIPPEDARFVLPNACATKIIVTMNARELMHFFRVRCCNRAQWEIRALAIEMLRCVKAVTSDIFADSGPACVDGKCSEGEMSCGKPWKRGGVD